MTSAKSLLYRMGVGFAGALGKIANSLDLRLKSPVFVIGTGRCGTSLLASILNSHPDIVGFPGEANELWHPKLYPFEQSRIEAPPIEVDPKQFTALSLRNWPPNHSKKIQDIFNGFHIIKGAGKVFFVKSAMISFMLPKIVDIFPDARFLHIYRYGPSVVASYFKKNRKKHSINAYTDEEYYQFCCEYWNSCILEIDRAQESLSLKAKNAYLEFSYEKICDEPESILKSIADYFGVDPSKFSFDLSTIQSTNYKADNNVHNNKFKEILRDTIYPAMKLKRYLS
jgi:hypothetical protein